jgi:hypothetical protein
MTNMLSRNLRKRLFTMPKWLKSASQQQDEQSNDRKAELRNDGHPLVVLSRGRTVADNGNTMAKVLVERPPLNRPKLRRSQRYTTPQPTDEDQSAAQARDNLEMVALNMYMDMYVKWNTSYSPAPQEEPLYNPTKGCLDVERPVFRRSQETYHIGKQDVKVAEAGDHTFDYFFTPVQEQGEPLIVLQRLGVDVVNADAAMQMLDYFRTRGSGNVAGTS